MARNIWHNRTYHGESDKLHAQAKHPIDSEGDFAYWSASLFVYATFDFESEKHYAVNYRCCEDCVEGYGVTINDSTIDLFGKLGAC